MVIWRPPESRDSAHALVAASAATASTATVAHHRAGFTAAEAWLAGGFLLLARLGLAPEHRQLRGCRPNADASGDRGTLPGAEFLVQPEQVVNAEGARADRGERDRGHA